MNTINNLVFPADADRVFFAISLSGRGINWSGAFKAPVFGPDRRDMAKEFVIFRGGRDQKGFAILGKFPVINEESILEIDDIRLIDFDDGFRDQFPILGIEFDLSHNAPPLQILKPKDATCCKDDMRN
jgi:hypothetical protein